MEQIKAMLDEMSKNDAFCGEMQALIKGGNPAAIAAAADKNGFAFTEGDWQAYSDWGKSLDIGTPSKELTPEELENVAGGAEWQWGSPSKPWIGECWFFASGEPEMKDGHMRKRCRQFACKANNGGGKNGNDATHSWYQCGCWGTDKCKGNWHYAEGCPS